MEKKYSPYKVIDGREYLVQDEDGQVFAGEWQEEQMDKSDKLTLGTYEDPVRGPLEIAGVPYDELLMHMTVTGQTGYGKSTTIANILYQLANDGFGFCYIDPTGYNSRDLIEILPEHREDDVVWIEPNTGRERVSGFNIIQTATDPNDEMYETEVQCVSDTLLSIFRDTIELDLEAKEDLQQFFESAVRSNEINTIEDVAEMIDKEINTDKSADWDKTREMSHLVLKNNEIFSSILQKLRSWTGHEPTANLLSPDNPRYNLCEAVKEGKIIILDSSHVESEQTKQILTRALISKVWTGARTKTDDDNFYLCTERYGHIVNENFDLNVILSQARSYNLGLILSVQQFSGLTDTASAGLRQAKHPLTFNPGQNSTDAASVAQLHEVGSNRVSSLERDEAIFQPVTSDGYKSEIPFNISMFGVPKPTGKNSNQVIKSSIEKHGYKK
jgi:hypothetical protein